MGTVFGKNTTSASITVAGHKVYYIDSTDAEIVEVKGTALSLYLSPSKSAVSVTDTGMFGVGYTLYLDDGSVYNESNVPGFIAAYNGGTSISDFENRLELIIRSGKVVLDGVGSYTTWVSRIEVSNPVKYNAFKYTLSGTPYWYVIDGEHDTWTDDLSAWGYSEVPVGPVLPTVILLAYNSNEWNYPASFNTNPVTFVNGEQAQLYIASSTSFSYESDKVYSVGEYQNPSGTTTGRYGFSVVSVNSKIGCKNISGGSITIQRMSVYRCSDSTATVVTVYDSSNNSYNAFKFTANNTDYYYVLDGTQTDWTDDLAGIGYSLTPNYLKGYINSSKSNSYVSRYAEKNLYDDAGNLIIGDSSKTYTIIGVYTANGGSVSYQNARLYAYENRLRFVWNDYDAYMAYIEYAVS